ncbi:MAG TPA: hypothetical protein VNK96_04305 [Fimbriimonadales bacterium]|nr:hypothetical protein [Fimbriimonadales bacterium]
MMWRLYCFRWLASVIERFDEAFFGPQEREIYWAFKPLAEKYKLSQTFDTRWFIGRYLNKKTGTGIYINRDDAELVVSICKLNNGKIILDNNFLLPVVFIAKVRGAHYQAPPYQLFMSFPSDTRKKILAELVRLCDEYASDFLSGDFSQWNVIVEKYRREHISEGLPEEHADELLTKINKAKGSKSLGCILIGTIILLSQIIFLMRGCKM